MANLQLASAGAKKMMASGTKRIGMGARRRRGATEGESDGGDSPLFSDAPPQTIGGTEWRN